MIFHGSRKLKKNETNYDTYDLELTSIVHALQMWRHYLMGNRFEFKIDHNILKHLFEQTHLNAIQVRWIEFMSEFIFEIKYIKDKYNIVAHAINKKIHLMQVSTIWDWKYGLKIMLQ